MKALALTSAVFFQIALPPTVHADPRISEFLAINGGPLVDEDNEETDWLEIENTGASAINLSGWHLTDDPENLTKWTFPTTQLPIGDFLIVFASGKDRIDGESELHTNFRLSGSGEFLALVEPDGTTIRQEFNPGFPQQFEGVSYGIDGNGGTGYFEAPTPGAANAGEAMTGFVNEDVEFSHNRGFYEAPFELALTTAEADAEIIFTTDGSEPSRSNGSLYTTPISIDTTATIRAGAFTPDREPIRSNTYTYIFLEGVLDQPARPPGFPSTWQPSLTADYAFDKSVATGEQLKNSLLALPTVSLVMAVDDWFNPSTNPAIGGIYSNSVNGQSGEWEREVSAEFFNFPDGREIQLNCGVRIFGNASRAISREKHNMRLIFRSEYGAGRLEFPLFGGAEDDVVNGYLFRGQNGDSWFHPTAGQRQEALYIRDQLARSMQKSMGQPATKQDHVHLYINGLYWGVMNTIERIEAESHVQAFGGREEEWDSLKSSRRGGMQVVDGSLDGWNAMQALANSGLAEDDAYAEIQEVLDLDNFIDWLLINFYNGNADWDDNNFQCARRRLPGEKWRFFVWDSERTLLGANANSTTKNFPGRGTRIHTRLRDNPEYRLKFADRIHKHMFNDGALTTEKVRESFNEWVNLLREPLRSESARWGDTDRRGNPYTVEDEWQTEVNFQNNVYMARRTNTVLNQLRAQDLYPDISAPVFNQHGGNVARDFELTISAPVGQIYYTTDGSDPRKSAEIGDEMILLDQGAPATAFIPTDESLGTAWQAVDFDDGTWIQGTTGIGYEARPADFTPLIGIDLKEMQGLNASAYVRVPFTIPDQNSLDAIGALTLNLKYEDGFVCHLNGQRVADSGNFTEPITFSTNSGRRDGGDDAALQFTPFDLSAGISNLVIGENVLSFQLMNSSAGNSDLLLVPQLVAQSKSAAGLSPSAQIYSAPLNLEEPVQINSRVISGGEWSALNNATFLVDTVPATSDNLAITEVNYHPANDDDGQEFIELTNISAQNIDLSGLYFSAGLTFDFDASNLLPTPVLVAGESLVIVGNLTDFAAAYPGANRVAGAFRGDLSNDGERISLRNEAGEIIHEFTYRDQAPWPLDADGSGATLTLADPTSAPDHSLPENWRASPLPGGSPTIPAVRFAESGKSVLDYAMTAQLEMGRDSAGRPLPGFGANPAAADAEFAFEVSDDLSTWTKISIFSPAVTVTPEGTVSLSTIGRKRYFRVKIAIR